MRRVCVCDRAERPSSTAVARARTGLPAGSCPLGDFLHHYHHHHHHHNNNNNDNVNIIARTRTHTQTPGMPAGACPRGGGGDQLLRARRGEAAGALPAGIVVHIMYIM
jgi:hypothetical protein